MAIEGSSKENVNVVSAIKERLFIIWGQNSSVGIETRYGQDDPGFEPR